MNRDERQQLRAITDELSSWIVLASGVLAQRAEVAKAANSAEAALRGGVVEVRQNGKVAWRAMVLRVRDGDRLRAIAQHTNLPPTSQDFDQQLVHLTTDVAAAVRDVQAVSGAGRFLSRSSTRDAGRRAAGYLTDYRAWFVSSRLPEGLRQLSTSDGRSPTAKIAVADALADGVGLASRVVNLGRPAEVVASKVFAGFPEANAAVQGAAADEARCRSAAVDAGNEVRRADTARMVADMGVDRLKEATRDKIRTGPLTDAGLTTVQAVLDYNGLQSLAGIGPTLATRIRGAARTLWQTTYDEMPARIDIKNRTADATELLRRLSVWDGVRKNLGGTRDLDLAEALAPFGKAIDEMVTNVAVFCAPHTSVSEFRQSIDTVVRRGRLITDAHSSVKGNDPWDDFLSRPADYFALLAELGFITEDAQKTHGDLSDDIVEAVRALELNTEYLAASLRGYQSFGARFALVQRKVIIGDEMGLGKTVEAIAVLAHLRAKGSHHSLVICPAAVVTNWIREVTSKSTLAAHRLHGPDRLAAAEYWIRKGGVAVTTFDTLTWLHETVTGLKDLSCVIVDEAHYIKNPEALRTRNSVRLLNSCERSVLLTGTPLENRIEEFRNLVSYLRPDLVVDANELAPKKFRRQVAPAYLRRNQEDVLTELPGMVEVDEWLTLSQEDLTAYRDAVAAGNFMAMRQAAMIQGRNSRKMQRLLEVVEEAEDNGRRVVVFSYFRDVLDQVARALPGRVFGPLTGSVPPAKRQTMIDEFSAAGHGAVLVAQVVAGGVGLNIQAASVVVICEPQLKPTTEWQAIARARRMGQLESVQVHRLLSEEGVDQRIREILARKSELFAEFARVSETADSAPEAFDVSEADLARQVIASERERLFGQPAAEGGRHASVAVAAGADDGADQGEAASSDSGARHRAEQAMDRKASNSTQSHATPRLDGGEYSAQTRDTSRQSVLPPGGPESPVSKASSPTRARLLRPYVSFDDTLPTISGAPLSAVAANVVRVVGVEGPLLGFRLHQVYFNASSGHWADRELARDLNRAITLAEKSGRIVSENPFGEEGVKPKTFRLSTQPAVVSRELGPRTLDLVPPAELAHDLAELCAAHASVSEEELFRKALDLFGLKQLTDSAKQTLSSAWALCEDSHAVRRRFKS
jgi:ERCC4-related helicase